MRGVYFFLLAALAVVYDPLSSTIKYICDTKSRMWHNNSVFDRLQLKLLKLCLEAGKKNDNDSRFEVCNVG